MGLPEIAQGKGARPHFVVAPGPGENIEWYSPYPCKWVLGSREVSIKIISCRFLPISSKMSSWVILRVLSERAGNFPRKVVKDFKLRIDSSMSRIASFLKRSLQSVFVLTGR